MNRTIESKGEKKFYCIAKLYLYHIYSKSGYIIFWNNYTIILFEAWNNIHSSNTLPLLV